MERDFIMDNETRRNIILDNYQYPLNKKIPQDKDNYIKINTRSNSCIDNLDIYVKLEENIIKDIKYDGEACVICISSTSILTDLLIGKSIDTAIKIIDNYQNMIEEKEYDKDILKDLIVYNEIYKQPSRKKCATLSNEGIKKIIKDIK